MGRRRANGKQAGSISVSIERAPLTRVWLVIVVIKESLPPFLDRWFLLLREGAHVMVSMVRRALSFSGRRVVRYTTVEAGKF